MKVLVICDNRDVLRRVRQATSESETGSHTFDFATTSRAIAGAENIPLIAIEEYERSIIAEGYELVISAHCKKIFPAALVNRVRCINIHPGYLPYNRGWYPHVFAMIRHQPAGVTIHEMDAAIDHGPIIARAQVEIRPSDTSLDVYEKILEEEYRLLKEQLRALLTHRYTTEPNTGSEPPHTLSDYRELCRLDLNRTMKLGEAIDLLRALSHPPYRNACFTDPATNETVFVELHLAKSTDEQS